MFTMLQDQHSKQITAMAEANKVNMKAMMMRINAIVTEAGGHALPTTTTMPPASGNPTAGETKLKKVKAKALCPLCKKMVLHKQNNCPELEENKEKWWPGWKSVNNTA